MNIKEIYEDNEPLRLAVKGYVPRLADYFRRWNVPLTEKVIRRQIEPYRTENGVGCYGRALAFVRGLEAIGKFERANYLASQFAIVTEKQKRKFVFGDWLERCFNLLGEMTALGLAGNFSQLELKKFEMRQLMAAEVV